MGSKRDQRKVSRSSRRHCRRARSAPYQLQAAIAAVHDEARTSEDTDWPQILALYGLLKRMSDNPMVALNHAIAAGMVHGPRAGLDLLKALDEDERLAGHYRIDAVRAHLLERAGDLDAAVEHYRAAADRTTSIPERDYLLTQAARISLVYSASLAWSLVQIRSGVSNARESWALRTKNGRTKNQGLWTKDGDQAESKQHDQ